MIFVSRQYKKLFTTVATDINPTWPFYFEELYFNIISINLTKAQKVSATSPLLRSLTNYTLSEHLLVFTATFFRRGGLTVTLPTFKVLISYCETHHCE